MTSETANQTTFLTLCCNHKCKRIDNEKEDKPSMTSNLHAYVEAANQQEHKQHRSHTYHNLSSFKCKTEIFLFNQVYFRSLQVT